MLEKLFKKQKIYSCLTFTGLFVILLYSFIASIAFAITVPVFLLGNISKSWLYGLIFIVVIITALIILFFAIKLILFTIYVKKLIRKRSYLHPANMDAGNKITQSAVALELNEEFHQTQLIGQGSFWQLYDATFNIYWRSRYSRYKAKEAYYTVFEAKLNYMTPHAIFDSIIGKKKQFKSLYLKSQKIQLGAGFDEHFETYVPEYYAMDTLTFMTPEVMEKATKIKDCDIELLQGSLLCYAPLLPVEQLAPFVQKCLTLHEALNDNLSSYRDSWLGKGQGVTEFGKQLLKNPIKLLWTALIFGCFSILGIVGAILSGDWFNLLDPRFGILVVIAILLFITYAKKLKQNKKMESDFRRDVLRSNVSKTREN